MRTETLAVPIWVFCAPTNRWREGVGLLSGDHGSLAVGGRELGRGLGDASSGVPATAQCR